MTHWFPRKVSIKEMTLTLNTQMPSFTVKILNFRTDISGQTVQTTPKIRLLLEEQSDQGLHCFLFNLHHLEVEPLSLNFRMFTVKLIGV